MGFLVGIPNIPTDPRVAGSLNSISASGFDQFGRQGSNPQFQNPFTVNPKVSWSKIVNRHTLKVGYEYLWLDTAIDDFNPAYGSFVYNGNFSQVGRLGPQLHLADAGVGLGRYVQDDWKVSPRLTLNLGMRYEFASPQWHNFAPRVGFAWRPFEQDGDPCGLRNQLPAVQPPGR